MIWPAIICNRCAPEPQCWLRITDKMPTNFLSIFGLIAMLFPPRQKIIHCRRDPLDTCLSCLMTDSRRRLRIQFQPGVARAFFTGNTTA